MQYLRTPLEGLWVIEPKLISDERGFFSENFRLDLLGQQIDPHFSIVQENMSHSRRGVFRGIHLQEEPYAQTKLVQCIEGEVLDFAFDLRPESKSYLQHFMLRLSAENHRQLYIPKGFGHAFYVLSKEATILYKVDALYEATADRSYSIFSPRLGFSFDAYGIDPEGLILSDKDRKAPYF